MENRPQNEEKHPPEYARDLSPDRLEGQNIGPNPDDREVGLRTAYDVRHLHRGLDLNDDELKDIPVLPQGKRLQQGGTYLDLRNPERGEFTATGDMASGPENAYVAKDQVPYQTWNKLRGIDDPQRTT